MLQQGPVPITRLPERLTPDPSRVILRFFGSADSARTRRTIERVLTLADDQVSGILDKLRKDFEPQHRNIAEIWAEHFERVQSHVPDSGSLSEQQQLLIGAYFTMQYAIEAAALFNPSMVPAIDQENLPPGATRFTMSLRATGEGHVSSIVFRRGVIDADNRVHIEPASPYSRPLPVVEDRLYENEECRRTLIEIDAYSELADRVLAQLPGEFTIQQLSDVLEHVRCRLGDPATMQRTADNLLSLARANYELQFPEDAALSECVIFPNSEAESQGIEDCRLVRFTNDDGSVRYYGTYTAFNGTRIMPLLFEVYEKRLRLRVCTLGGVYAQNKGMALFPRKVGGQYMMSGRLDGENLFILHSDSIRIWNHGKLVQEPKYWWQMSIIGNCGPPMETEEGWLLLTHGVGPMRQYCIGATLLDLDDPTKIIGQTQDPLIVPIGEERIGYVPNVVYSCGGMIHNDVLIIPYAMSDVITTFATVPLPDLLDYIKGKGT